MAKRFVFRLETVRRLREQEVERQQRVLAERIRGVQELDSYIGELNRELREIVQANRGFQERGTLDVPSLKSHQLHGGWLRRQILSSREELSRREKAVSEERQKLVDVNTRLKVIEKLRERHWARHRDVVNREEQAANDEVGTQLFYRDKSAAATEGIG